MTSHIQITFTDSLPLRIDRFIKNRHPSLSYVVIQKWLRTGSVRVNGKRIKASHRLTQGDELKMPVCDVQAQRDARPACPPEWVEKVHSWLVYEDERLLAFNKPAGLAVQGGSKITLSLDRLVQEAFNDPEIRVVHRLDRETSGLIIFARNRQWAQELAKAFHDHAIIKTYHALVVGIPKPSQGMIETRMMKCGTNYEKMEVSLDGPEAITQYKTLTRPKHSPLTLVELTPKTGRTHQLRVHMAYIDTPILGDGKYGNKLAHPFMARTDLALHASALELPGGLSSLSVPLPEWFEEALLKG